MKKLTFLLILVTFVVSFFSCNREIVSTDLEEITTINASNPLNPYDFIGEMHNKALGNVMMQVSISSKKMSIQEIIDISRACSFEQLSIFPMTKSITLDEIEGMTEEEVLRLLEDFDNNFDNFINELDLSLQAKSELRTFVSTMLSMSETDNLDYDMLYQEVVNFENSLLVNGQTELNEIDELAVLGGTATLRYSLAYWEDTCVTLDTKSGPRKWWKWVVIGLADACGAVTGAITGYTVGTAIERPILGAVAGAVGGAVTASSTATTWVDKWGSSSVE